MFFYKDNEHERQILKGQVYIRMEKDFAMDANSYLPLREEVFNTLRDQILKGELSPGDRLMEIHLADRLGVSRTPVREAIRMLEREGLAITIPRRGAQVAKMTEKDLSDVLEVREALDELAVTKACENMSPEIIKKLESSVVDFKEAIKTGDPKRIVEADEAFHHIIYEAADNPRLLSITDHLKEQMYRFRFEYVREEKDYDKLINEHERLIEGLKAGDVESVKRDMHTHLENQVEAVKRIIREYDR